MRPEGSPPDTSTVPPGESPRRLGAFRRPRVLVPALVALGILLVAGVVLARRDSSPAPPSRAEVSKIAADAAKKAVDDLDSRPAVGAAVYQQILPSLVEIETDEPGKGDAKGLGAGVIVNRNGTILTALHVVDGATRIRVSFVDGTRSTATVASRDAANDIAALMPERGPQTIVPAVLGGGGQVGDETFAVGHPLGLVGSLSAGVISGLDRTIDGEDGKTMKGLIQFDAAVNPGNSGGPLLNRGGQVIGIVTSLANPSAQATRSGFFIGIGFAVPIGTAGGAANAPPK